MYLHDSLHKPLARVNDADWQLVLDRHPFWRSAGRRVDDEHEDIAFHILMHEGELAEALMPSHAAFEFDAVPIPINVFEDSVVSRRVQQWAEMHAERYGAGVTVKMGLYVVRAGGTLGYHVDGPVFLKGQRADLSRTELQRALVEVQASHRTILPLRFNADDRFMICNYRVPLVRGELFEFSNVVPHAFFNRGKAHAVLLVTTYLDEALLPMQYTYSDAVAV